MRIRLWIPFCLIVGLVGLAILATSCGGGSSKTQIRLLNAIVLYGDLNMLIDGNTAASSVAYGSASSYASVSSGSRHIQIEPTGSSFPIIDTSTNVNSRTATTALAYLNPSNSVSYAALADNNATPSSGNINIRIINASPAFPSADVYVVPSGTSITGVSPTISATANGTQDNGAASQYFSFPAGNYDVIFAFPGTKSELPGGDSGQISFSAGQVRTAVGLNSSVSGFSIAVLSDAG